MCIFTPPKIPGPDPAIEAERQERMAAENADKRARRDDALEDTVARRKKGRGPRGLMSGQSGGIGYYKPYRNE
jgi:hypothetical protein